MEKYINDLLILCNKYYYFDIDYIKTKYNIKKYELWEQFFKENSHLKLIFNCYNAEILFIFIFNIDKKYIESNYNISINNLLHDFFINKIDYYFSYCHENYINSKKHTMHLKNKCCCFIKVKSIVNLNINTFMYIHKNNFNPNNFDIDIINPNLNSQFKLSLENLKQLKNKIPNNLYSINTQKIDEIIIKPNKDILLETLIENNINYIFNKNITNNIENNNLKNSNAKNNIINLINNNENKKLENNENKKFDNNENKKFDNNENKKLENNKKIDNNKNKKLENKKISIHSNFDATLENSMDNNTINSTETESVNTSETQNTQISSVKGNKQEINIIQQKENEINKKKKMLMLLNTK